MYPNAKFLVINNAVLFMGRRSDIGQLMSAMDALLLPSLYEDLPVVCIESSANALTSIISKEAYAQELECLSCARGISLKKPAIEWATFVLEITNSSVSAYRNRNLIAGSSFDIDNAVSALQEIYLNH